MKKVKILDGAVGTMLQIKFGEVYSKTTWMNEAIIKHPDYLVDVHRQYIRAGADIITTMTFRTNIHAIKDTALQQQIMSIAVRSAQEAVKLEGRPVLVAGSNTAAEDCYQPNRKISPAQLHRNHLDHITRLHALGVDFILNETLGHADEIELTSQICQDLNVPYMLSLYCTDQLRLLSGEHLQDYLPKYTATYKPQLISFNCIPVSTMQKIVQEIKLDFPWGSYVNCGQCSEVHMDLDYTVTPQQLLDFSKQLGGASMLGSCCLSTPEHTLALSTLK